MGALEQGEVDVVKEVRHGVREGVAEDVVRGQLLQHRHEATNVANRRTLNHRIAVAIARLGVKLLTACVRRV